MELVRFYALVVKIAIALALVGQLKSCTLELLGLAAAKSNHGAALARRRRLDVDRADTERQIDAQVVTSVKMVTSARTRVALADKAIAVAEENAKAEKLSFAAGKSTNFSVMDRQTQLVDEVQRLGAVSVEALAEHFGVTVQSVTIRETDTKAELEIVAADTVPDGLHRLRVVASGPPAP